MEVGVSNELKKKEREENIGGKKGKRWLVPQGPRRH